MRSCGLPKPFLLELFLTAYSDRDDGSFKRSVSELAWQSFAWFMSEPDHIVAFHRGGTPRQSPLWHLMWS